MTTRVITLWRVSVTSLTTSVSTMHFLIEIMFILKAKESHFEGSYAKQNISLVVISYEIYETSIQNDHECKILYVSDQSESLVLPLSYMYFVRTSSVHRKKKKQICFVQIPLHTYLSNGTGKFWLIMLRRCVNFQFSCSWRERNCALTRHLN